MWVFCPRSGAMVVGAPEVQVVKAIRAASATSPVKAKRPWAGRAAPSVSTPAARGWWIRLGKEILIVYLALAGSCSVTRDPRSESRAQSTDPPSTDRYGNRYGPEGIRGKGDLIPCPLPL